MKRYYIAAAVLIFIALAAGVANSLVSKPYVTDRMTTEDLRTLDSVIINYHNDNQKLPETLAQLDIKGDLKSRLENYEYTRTSDVASANIKSPKSGLSYSPTPNIQKSFTLCATFKTSTFNDRTKFVPAGFNPEVHEKGRQCFTDYASEFNTAATKYR